MGRETEMTVSIVEKVDRKNLWIAAIKPPMYTVAVTPIWVTTAAAAASGRTIDTKTSLTFLISAILIIAWLNLSNDVFDSDTGVDINKASSVVNLTGNRNLILWISNFCLIIGVLGIGAISWWQKDPTVVFLSAIAVAFGYAYQGPPFRLSYLGLGEIISVITFGPLFCSAVYYSQTKAWSWSNLGVSSVIGIATSLILFCSHFHQIEDDRQAGKKSPIVRLGTQKAADLLPWYASSIYGLTTLFILLGIFPWTTIAIFASAPLAIALIQRVKQYHDVPDKIANCKFIAVRLHFLAGLLLGGGLLVSRWFT